MRMKNKSVPYGNGGGYGVECGGWEGVVDVPSSDAHHAVWGNPSGRQQTLVRMRVGLGIAEEAPSLIHMLQSLEAEAACDTFPGVKEREVSRVEMQSCELEKDFGSREQRKWFLRC